MGEASGELSGIRVAIVEDDALLRESLALFLRMKGCRVETFGSAEEADDPARLGEFGVVISDFLLSGEDGLSFLRRVRKANKDVTTVIITAHGNRDFLGEVGRSGIDAYLPKPISTEELEGTLKRLTEKRRGGNPPIRSEIA